MAGMAARAEHGEMKTVRRVVRKVGDVQHAVRTMAGFAAIPGALNQLDPKAAPVGTIKAAVLGTNRHGSGEPPRSYLLRGFRYDNASRRQVRHNSKR